MEISSTPTLSPPQKAQLLALWNNESVKQLCYPNLQAMESYLAGLSSITHYLATEAARIKGWAMVFTREGARWFAILLDSTVQRQGLGSRMLNAMKANEAELNGWVIDHDRDVLANGQPYHSPSSFYEKNGFTFIPETRLETDILSCVKIQWKASAAKA